MKLSNHLDFEGVNRARNLPAPVDLDDAVRQRDLNSAVAGLRDKPSCRVATQGNLNLASPGTTIDGITMAANDRVLVRSQTAASENGIYVWNGAAVAMTRGLLSDTSDELEQAITTIEEGTDAGRTWRQTSVNFVLETGAINWVQFGTTSAAATTTTLGTVTLGTQAKVDGTVDSDDVITVTTLRAWAGRKQKVTAQIGDGSATQYDVTHGFNTRDFVGTLRRNVAPFDILICDQEYTDLNTVRLKFSAAVASNAYTYIAIA